MKLLLPNSSAPAFQGEPKLGDHISFAGKKLLIQGMDRERITKVGLEF
jgi:hypothetical protein